MDCARRSYQPRHAEASVLHGVVRDHVDDFLRAAADRADGAGVGPGSRGRLPGRCPAPRGELPPPGVETPV
jgi:hypothetical protein